MTVRRLPGASIVFAVVCLALLIYTHRRAGLRQVEQPGACADVQSLFPSSTGVVVRALPPSALGVRAISERKPPTVPSLKAWLREHPEVVIGTVVVIGGIAYVVATGGTGALILIPATL